jgi:hypothetical protein
MEATADIFEENLDKMDITDFETHQEKLEVVPVHQMVPNEEAVVEETIGAVDD